jgi:hypothetical protein
MESHVGHQFNVPPWLVHRDPYFSLSENALENAITFYHQVQALQFHFRLSLNKVVGCMFSVEHIQPHHHFPNLHVLKGLGEALDKHYLLPLSLKLPIMHTFSFGHKSS